MISNSFDYWCLGLLGGEIGLTFYELKLLLPSMLSHIKINDKKVKKNLHKFLEYNLLKLNESSCNPFSNIIRFSITSKGMEALQSYKYQRYHNSGRDAWRLKEEEEKQVNVGLNSIRDKSTYFDRDGRRHMDVDKM